MARGRSFSRTDSQMLQVVKAGTDLNGPALARLCKKERISVATWYNWQKRLLPTGKTVQLASGNTATIIDLREMEARNKALSNILAQAVILKREEERLRLELAKLN